MQAERLNSAHRGAGDNPVNRFEKIQIDPDVDQSSFHSDSTGWNPDWAVLPRTTFYKDHSKTVIARNDSPDVGFTTSLNPYRGCEHGCIYCYARPTHEFLGFSAGLDFESKIMIKEDAPELLRAELMSPKWQPQVIFMSGVTDCYQPVEAKLKLTRRCLKVLAEFRNPVFIITKNHLVTRDIDLLSELARYQAVEVWLSITTLDPELRKVMEPRTSPPSARLAAIRELTEAGIRAGVNVAPIIPGLTDHEMPAILQAAADAGAKAAGYTLVRLPYGVAPLFQKWLEIHFPDRKEKVLNRLRSIRGGKLNESQWGTRMHGEGIFADQISQLFEVARRKAGIPSDISGLSAAAFRRPPGAQLSLFS